MIFIWKSASPPDICMIPFFFEFIHNYGNPLTSSSVNCIWTCLFTCETNDSYLHAWQKTMIMTKKIRHEVSRKLDTKITSACPSTQWRVQVVKIFIMLESQGKCFMCSQQTFLKVSLHLISTASWTHSWANSGISCHTCG